MSSLPTIIIALGLTYDDVLLVPNYSEISQFIKINYIDNALLNGTTISLDGSLTNIDQVYFNIN